MGWNWIERSLILCQVPAVCGETGGIEPPSACETGFEKVSVIGVVALILLPGAG